MPNEERISKLVTIFEELGSNIGKGAVSIVPNNEVVDDSPADLPAGYIKVADELGYYVPAVVVANLVVATGQFVNLLYIEGTEPIAFQQGSSGTTNVALWQLVGGTGPDIYYSNGNVGIGKTVAPDAALEVLDTSQAQLRLTFEEDVKFTTFTVDTNHDLTIDPSSTGLIKLAATVTVPDEIQHEGDLTSKMAFATGQWDLTVGGVSMIRAHNTTQDVLHLGDVAGTGDVDVKINVDHLFVRGSDGRVGIGTAAPAQFFVVTDPGNMIARFQTTTSTTFCGFQNLADSTATLNSQLFGSAFAGSQFSNARADTASLFSDGAATNLFTFGTKTSHDLVLGTVNVERMRIDTSGNVGIGETNPTTKFFVNSGGTNVGIHLKSTDAFTIIELEDDTGTSSFGTFGTQLIFTGGAGLGGARYMDLSGTAAIFNELSADIDFRVESNIDTHALFVQGSDSFVGLGVTVPSTRLDVGAGAMTFAEMTAPSNPAANGTVLYAEDDATVTRQQIKFNSGNAVTIAKDGGLQTYTPTNVVTDRSYDANATSVAELADVLGTLIADFQTAGILG